jgi:hypothetical protein
MDKLMESKIQSCAASSRSIGNREWVWPMAAIDPYRRKIMAMPMMDNDRPGRSVDETYAENQRRLERSTDQWNHRSVFINTLCNRFRAWWQTKKPLPDWVNEADPWYGVANTRKTNTRLDFDMSSTGMKLSNIWTNTHVRRTSKSEKHGLRNSRGFDWVRDFHELCARRKSSSKIRKNGGLSSDQVQIEE